MSDGSSQATFKKSMRWLIWICVLMDRYRKRRRNLRNWLKTFMLGSKFPLQILTSFKVGVKTIPASDWVLTSLWKPYVKYEGISWTGLKLWAGMSILEVFVKINRPFKLGYPISNPILPVYHWTSSKAECRCIPGHGPLISQFPYQDKLVHPLSSGELGNLLLGFQVI